jgi:hypothetical protein
MVGLVNILVVVFLLGLHSSILATGVGTAIVCVIFALFLLTSLRSGLDSFKLSTIVEKYKNENYEGGANLKDIKSGVSVNKFVASLSMGLGMLGTVCGLILMFSGIDQNIDPSNYQANIQLLKVVSAGFGVALYTTLVGLASSLLLAVQGFNIEHEIRKFEDAVYTSDYFKRVAKKSSEKVENPKSSKKKGKKKNNE